MESSMMIDQLMKFGLTRQEAIVYHCLLTDGKNSGYEVAKITGISRSNAYSALSSLSEKGAAYLLEEGTTKKYLAVDPLEFCENYIFRLQDTKQWIKIHIPDRKRQEEGYITIEGEEHIRDKVRNLLTNAQERIYISCTGSYLSLFKEYLEQLLLNKKKVVIITDHSEDIKGAKIYISQNKGCQIGIIVDSRYALTGEFGKGSINTCLYSAQQNFIKLYKNALANEIKLIQYTKGEIKTNE